MLRHLIPRRLRYQLRGAQWALRHVQCVWRRFGWRTALAFVTTEPWVAVRLATGLTSVDRFDIPVPDAPSVTCRAYSSDREVFLHTVAWRPYDWLERSEAPLRVLDCGANIGTATLAILERYPNATVLALEPDADNFAILVQNTRHVTRHVIAVQGALWPVAGAVVFDEEKFRDGRQWAIHVRPARPGERAEVTAYDVPGLMQRAGWDRVDLLKMDIEGAETPVLESAESWLDRIDVIAVELHDDAAATAFKHAVGDHFRVSRHGELTVGRRG